MGIVDKSLVGAAVGGIIGFGFAVNAWLEGAGFFQGLIAVPASAAIIGINVLLYLAYKKVEGGQLKYHASTDDEISRLQNQLYKNMNAIASFEQGGRYSDAAALKSHNAVIESKLRRLGA